MKRFNYIIALTFFILSSATSLTAADGWWAIRCTYSLKWYTYSAGDRINHCNFWGESGLMQGLQFGVPIEPTFNRSDWGIATGLFCEVFSCKDRAQTKRIEDVALSLPVRALWRHHFNNRISLQASSGPAVNIGLLQCVIDPKDSTKKGFHIPFGDGSPNRVNLYWEAGIAATFRMFRFGVDYGVSLTPSRNFLSFQGSGNYTRPARPHRFSISFAIAF